MEYPKVQYSVFMDPARNKQFVLRADTIEELRELKEELDAMMSGNEAPSHTTESYAPEENVMCDLHGKPMKMREGKSGPFWSHGRKNPDGSFSWCSGKGWK